MVGIVELALQLNRRRGMLYVVFGRDRNHCEGIRVWRSAVSRVWRRVDLARAMPRSSPRSQVHHAVICDTRIVGEILRVVLFMLPRV